MRVYVAISNRSKFDRVFHAIQAVCNHLGHEVMRGGPAPAGAALAPDPVEEVGLCDLVIADFSGDDDPRIPNPDIVTEACIARFSSPAKPVILTLAGRSEWLPAHWQGRTPICYSPVRLDEFKSTLANAVAHLIGRATPEPGSLPAPTPEPSGGPPAPTPAPATGRPAPAPATGQHRPAPAAPGAALPAPGSAASAVPRGGVIGPAPKAGQSVNIIPTGAAAAAPGAHAVIKDGPLANFMFEEDEIEDDLPPYMRHTLVPPTAQEARASKAQPDALQPGAPHAGAPGTIARGSAHASAAEVHAEPAVPEISGPEDPNALTVFMVLRDWFDDLPGSLKEQIRAEGITMKRLSMGPLSRAAIEPQLVDDPRATPERSAYDLAVLEVLARYTKMDSEVKQALRHAYRAGSTALWRVQYADTPVLFHAW